jgi:hypothetical protein
MPYITVSDVTAAAPGIDINATSRPSQGQVNDLIASEEKTLLATLAAIGYQIPLTPKAGTTGEQGLAIVKKILTHRVLAHVLRAKAYGKANPRDIGAKDADDVASMLIARLTNPDDELTLGDLIVIDAIKDQSLAGSDALVGSRSTDMETPITRYTRF